MMNDNYVVSPYLRLSSDDGLHGDSQKAAECFARGGESGAVNGAELQKHLKSNTPE